MVHSLVGRRHTGKTTLADYLAARTTYRLRFSPRNSLPHYPDDLFLTAFTGESLRFTADVKSITIVPELHVDESFERTMRAFKSWYLAHERELLTTNKTVSVLVDEARFGGVKDSESFDWIIRCTDRETVHVLLTMHRPKDIHPDIRAIVDYWYVFFLNHPLDLEVLTNECGDAVATLAPKLLERQFVCYSVNTPPGVRAYQLRKDAGTWAPSGSGIARQTSAKLLDDDKTPEENWSLD